MTQTILDTNVLLRFLVGDEPKQQALAKQWFKEAEQGKRKIVVDPLVIAETVFVLESFYKQDRTSIAEALAVFVSQRWLIVRERDSLEQLWTWYKTGLHFVDSFLIAWSIRHDCQVLSFDQELKKKLKT